jgi:hypothetical protein
MKAAAFAINQSPQKILPNLTVLLASLCALHTS